MRCEAAGESEFNTRFAALTNQAARAVREGLEDAGDKRTGGGNFGARYPLSSEAIDGVVLGFEVLKRPS